MNVDLKLICVKELRTVHRLGLLNHVVEDTVGFYLLFKTSLLSTNLPAPLRVLCWSRTEPATVSVKRCYVTYLFMHHLINTTASPNTIRKHIPITKHILFVATPNHSAGHVKPPLPHEILIQAYFAPAKRFRDTKLTVALSSHLSQIIRSS